MSGFLTALTGLSDWDSDHELKYSVQYSDLKPKMNSERRKYKRYIFADNENFLTSFVWKGKPVIDLRIIRLSAGGMFAAAQPEQVSSFVRHDTIEEVRFTLKSFEIMVPTARIAHTYPLGAIHGCGIEFLDLNQAQIDSLESLLEVTVHEARARPD